jgi:hypothetical protein
VLVRPVSSDSFCTQGVGLLVPNLPQEGNRKSWRLHSRHRASLKALRALLSTLPGRVYDVAARPRIAAHPAQKAKSRSLTPAWNAAGIGMTTLFAMRDEILRKIRILMN